MAEDLTDTALDAVEGVAENATGRDLSKVREIAEDLVRKIEDAPDAHVHDPSVGGTDVIRKIAYGVAHALEERLGALVDELAPKKAAPKAQKPAAE